MRRPRTLPEQNPALKKHYRKIRESKRFLNELNLTFQRFKEWREERERIEKAMRENPTLYPEMKRGVV